MDEYALNVIIDGYEEKILTYATSFTMVIESMIKIEAITHLLKAVRIKDNKEWVLKDGDLVKLREEINEEDFTED